MAHFDAKYDIRDYNYPPLITGSDFLLHQPWPLTWNVGHLNLSIFTFELPHAIPAQLCCQVWAKMWSDWHQIEQNVVPGIISVVPNKYYNLNEPKCTEILFWKVSYLSSSVQILLHCRWLSDKTWMKQLCVQLDSRYINHREFFFF